MTTGDLSDDDFLDIWHDALRQHGWEAITSRALGEVAGRLERGSAAWTLVVDRARRFRFTVSQPTRPDAWSEIAIDGRSYACLHEVRRTLTITGQITADLLPETLLADLAFAADTPAIDAG